MAPSPVAVVPFSCENEPPTTTRELSGVIVMACHGAVVDVRGPGQQCAVARVEGRQVRPAARADRGEGATDVDGVVGHGDRVDGGIHTVGEGGDQRPVGRVEGRQTVAVDSAVVDRGEGTTDVDPLAVRRGGDRLDLPVHVGRERRDQLTGTDVVREQVGPLDLVDARRLSPPGVRRRTDLPRTRCRRRSPGPRPRRRSAPSARRRPSRQRWAAARPGPLLRPPASPPTAGSPTSRARPWSPPARAGQAEVFPAFFPEICCAGNPPVPAPRDRLPGQSSEE